MILKNGQIYFKILRWKHHKIFKTRLDIFQNYGWKGWCVALGIGRLLLQSPLEARPGLWTRPCTRLLLILKSKPQQRQWLKSAEKAVPLKIAQRCCQVTDKNNRSFFWSFRKYLKLIPLRTVMGNFFGFRL